MHFNCQIDIDLRKDKLVDLIMNKAKTKNWRSTFLSETLISGENGKAGSKYLVRFLKDHFSGEVFEYQIVIKSEDLPDEISYIVKINDQKGIENHSFIYLDNDKARWAIDCSYAFFGLTRILAVLLPWVVKKNLVRETNKTMKLLQVYAKSLQHKNKSPDMNPWQ